MLFSVRFFRPEEFLAFDKLGELDFEGGLAAEVGRKELSPLSLSSAGRGAQRLASPSCMANAAGT